MKQVMRFGLWCLALVAIVGSAGCREPKGVAAVGTTPQGGSGDGSSFPRHSMLPALACPPVPVSALGGTDGTDPVQGSVQTPDCKPTDCGTNGPWAGQGFKYRSLHLPAPNGKGGFNAEQIAIISFRKNDRNLVMGIADGDRLVGYDGDVELSGKNLVDAEIVLRDASPGCHGGDCSSTLTIKDYADVPFWTKCTNDSDPKCAGMLASTPAYAFQVTRGDGGCAVLCDPNITNADDDLAGAAVIFQGDVYDDDGEHGVKIRSADGTKDVDKLKPDGSEKDQFNIACYGTAISKLHFLRHTYASMTKALGKTEVAERQSMLQLLSGDYCGDGSIYTKNGLPLRMDYDHPPLHPAYEDVGVPGAQSLDALWSHDGTGATCIGIPRLLAQTAQPPGTDVVKDFVTEIQGACDRPTPLVSCTAEQQAVALQGMFGGAYAISANPPHAP